MCISTQCPYVQQLHAPRPIPRNVCTSIQWPCVQQLHAHAPSPGMCVFPHNGPMYSSQTPTPRPQECVYFHTMALCAARHGPHNATLKPRRWPLRAVLGPRAAQNVRGSYADFGRHGFGSICGWGNSPYVPTMSLDNVPMCTADARPRPPSPGMCVFPYDAPMYSSCTPTPTIPRNVCISIQRPYVQQLHAHVHHPQECMYFNGIA